jgi:hypothetical protein
MRIPERIDYKVYVLLYYVKLIIYAMPSLLPKVVSRRPGRAQVGQLQHCICHSDNDAEAHTTTVDLKCLKREGFCGMKSKTLIRAYNFLNIDTQVRVYFQPEYVLLINLTSPCLEAMKGTLLGFVRLLEISGSILYYSFVGGQHDGRGRQRGGHDRGPA